MERIAVPEAWTPRWAQAHIIATYTPLLRDPETNEVDEPQRVYCRCGNCGGVLQRTCDRGLARDHIQTFCRVHNNCPAPTVST